LHIHSSLIVSVVSNLVPPTTPESAAPVKRQKLFIGAAEFPGSNADELIVATPVQRVTLRKETNRDEPAASRQFNFFRGRNIEDGRDWVVGVARFRLPKRLMRNTKGQLG
jgi:hypothetical protein